MEAIYPVRGEMDPVSATAPRVANEFRYEKDEHHGTDRYHDKNCKQQRYQSV
jgi:hypothetical protein